MTVNVPLKLKYRAGKVYKGQHGSHGGNHGTSAGKHLPHPDVFAYRRNGYRCEPKWNQQLKDRKV